MAWYLWVDDNKVAANCSDLSTLSEKSAGFQGGKAAVAKNVNVALRQANLVACALMDVIDSQSVLSYSNSRQEIAAQCSAYFNKFATLAALGSEENWLVANANNTRNAANAQNANNATNTDFTNAEWSDSVSSTTLTNGLYQILTENYMTGFLHYDEQDPAHGSPCIVNIYESSSNLVISVRKPNISKGVLTISNKSYYISNGGSFEAYDYGNINFKYRKIR